MFFYCHKMKEFYRFRTSLTILIYLLCRCRSAAMRARWKEALLAASLWTVFVSCRSAAAAASCEDLLTEFRYPCTCSELSQIGGLALNCDGVVYPSDHVNLPKDAPVVVFTQRNAGHHSVPAHLFPSTGESRVQQSCGGPGTRPGPWPPSNKN